MNTENQNVKFIKPIIDSDFIEVGMKATLVLATKIDETKHQLLFDFSGFEEYNIARMSKRFENSFSNKKVTAKEAGMYGVTYVVSVDATEETLQDVLTKHLEAIE